MIVATAGHIDHGKTALVKALTGVDTDRLPEEKARGISIDLGFAYWREPLGRLVAFVDVPGHERFIHNMLAGICAIDFVLLVVAADDGVMPQTREHLDIIDLLGIREGAIVITKADRVDSQRLLEVTADAGALARSTGLARAPCVATSTVTGDGLDQLRDLLAQAAGSATRQRTSGTRFRLAVDRSFSVTGSGTVVTGTVFDGSVKAGDRLVVSPGGIEVRVRGVHAAGQRVNTADAGERCALNLAGIDLARVGRGDWVLDPDIHLPTERLDVRIDVIAGATHGLRHLTPLHLHLGTQDVGARVMLRRSATIAPGATGFARIALARPIAALRGDRFIVRDQSARRTLAGGIVLDAFPASRRLAADAFDRRMRALARAPAEALATLASAADTGEDAQTFSRNYNLDPAALRRIVAECGLEMLSIAGASPRIVTREARAGALKTAPPIVADDPEHTRLWQLAKDVFARPGSTTLTVTRLADLIDAEPAVLNDLLYRRTGSGELVRFGEDRFMLRSAIDRYATFAHGLAHSAPEGRFTAAAFRDAAGVGRDFAIDVLEVMDGLGITRRIGNARIVLPANHSRL